MTRRRGETQFLDKKITSYHGAGGEASRRLIEGLFAPAFSNAVLDELADAAVLERPAGRIAVATDSFVVKPLVFPGGSIGRLAVHGSVNDLAVVGAVPFSMTASFILEEGLDCDILRREVLAMAEAARNAGTAIVAGDVKVVELGKADGLYITTTGLGVLHPRAALGASRVEPGDQILLSGPIGNHGVSVMLARTQLDLQADVRSDTRPIVELTTAILEAADDGVHWMRDATRGGVATVLNELARDADVLISIEDSSIPVDDVVRGACELLGLDPLYIANEGQFVAVVSEGSADDALAALRRTPGGERACAIGRIESAGVGRVVARTPFGGKRVLDMLAGDPLPRIC